MTHPLRLDLGSGPRPKEGFKGVDRIPGLTDYTVDFNSGRPWPFDDNSVDELRSSHCIEHIHQREEPVWEPVQGYVAPGITWQPPYDLIVWVGERPWCISHRPPLNLLFHFFEQAFRIAKPGARFEVRCPSAFHVHAHGDPTHCRTISHDLLYYLSRQGRKDRGVDFYGVDCNWVGEVQFAAPKPDGLELGSVGEAVWQTELVDRLQREINVAHELIFNLTAEK